MKYRVVVAAVVSILIPCVTARPGWQNSMSRIPRTEYEIVGQYPHDPNAYTQGLVWHKEGFYESTGLYGQSSLRRVEFPSGKVLKSLRLAPDLFAEGLALANGKLVQLTWKSGKGFEYDMGSFRLIRDFRYETEGWGLAWDGHYLIMSDGSSTLTYMDPDDYKPVKRLRVNIDGKPIDNLNELEFIKGEIWSNVWMSDVILRISPVSGRVVSYLDMRGIRPANPNRSSDDVLNGIAFDPQTGRVFVGGKRWPMIFAIRPKDLAGNRHALLKAGACAQKT